MKLKRPREEHGRVRVASSSGTPTNHKYAAFSLRYVVGDQCITRCTNEQAMQFAERMKRLCSMTWQQIQNADRHGLGTEIIKQSSLRVAIPGHITPDVNLLAFRCFGMAPMIGYREEEVFFVLWFDPDFEVYKHG